MVYIYHSSVHSIIFVTLRKRVGVNFSVCGGLATILFLSVSPRVSCHLFSCDFQDKLEVVLQASVLSQDDPDLVARLWGTCSSAMFSLLPRERQLGLGDEVMTTPTPHLTTGIIVCCLGNHYLLLWELYKS